MPCIVHSCRLAKNLQAASGCRAQSHRTLRMSCMCKAVVVSLTDARQQPTAAWVLVGVGQAGYNCGMHVCQHYCERCHAAR